MAGEGGVGWRPRYVRGECPEHTVPGVPKWHNRNLVTLAEHILRKIHHCTFRAWKLQSFWQKFLITFFLQKFLSVKPNFLLNYIQLLISATGQTIITAKIAFHHCTFQFITPHFEHHCMVKQALLEEIVGLLWRNKQWRQSKPRTEQWRKQIIIQWKPWRNIVGGMVAHW